MKYTMYKYDAKTKEWNVHTQFDNKEELLRFLSYGTKTYNGAPRHRWYNPYFDEQNLTCKDVLVNRRWERLRDDEGYLMYDEKGFPLYEHNIYRTVREWHLEDEEGRTVDANIFKKEVYDMVEDMSFYVRNTLYLRTYKRKKCKEPMGRSWHHAVEYRCSSKNHRYGRTLKTVEESAEGVEDMLTQHQMQCLKVKPKDMYGKYAWGDDFWRKGSSGWKEHKNVKQWEAKQKRTEHVWVENLDRKQVQIDPELFEECIPA